LKDQVILITGSSGFLGTHFVQELEKENQVITLSRNKSSDIILDLSKSIPELPKIDIVIHCAGKAHSIPKTKEDADAFYIVNYQGTKNLFAGLKPSIKTLRSFIFISTVAVYGLEKGENIVESTPLNGSSPYAKSKIHAEELVLRWTKENNINFSILRLPLIFGWNAPGNLGDLIKKIKQGFGIKISNLEAKKSVVLIDDIAEQLEKFINANDTFNLTDGHHPTFNNIVDTISKKYGKKPISINLKLLQWVAKIGDRWGNFFPLNSSKVNKINSSLTFSDERARKDVGWNSRRVVDTP